MPIDRCEYIRIPIAMIPQKFMDQYNLHNKVYNNAVHAEASQLPLRQLLEQGRSVNRSSRDWSRTSVLTTRYFSHILLQLHSLCDVLACLAMSRLTRAWHALDDPMLP